MADDSMPPAERPEFNALIADLRQLVRQQDSTAKAEAARRAGVEVMRKSALLFAQGKITAHQLTSLHAAKMRLDLTLPEERY